MVTVTCVRAVEVQHNIVMPLLSCNNLLFVILALPIYLPIYTVIIMVLPFACYILSYNDLVIVDVSKIILRNIPMDADELINFIQESCDVIRDVSRVTLSISWSTILLS